MSDLKIRFSRFTNARDVFLAELDGSIDASTVHIFQQGLEKARRQGVNKLVLDISRIRYVNSTGLGSLVKYADAFRAAGGGLVLLKVPPKVKIVIEMLGLHEFFEMAATPQEALARLTEAASAGSSAAPAVAQRPAPVAAKQVSPSAPVARPKPSATRGAMAASPPKAPTAKPPSQPPSKPADAQQPAASAAKPAAPAPAAPQKTAPPRPTSAATFPIVVPCGTCTVDVEIPRSGNFKCPRCQTIISVDSAGNVSFFAPNKPIPFQMTLSSNSIASEALKGFVGVVAERLGFGASDTSAIVAAVAEVASVIAERVYQGEENTYSVVITPDANELTVVFSDHGETLPADVVSSVFPHSSTAFDEFEVSPHPRGGNIIRFVKRK